LRSAPSSGRNWTSGNVMRCTHASAMSSTYMNSRRGVPVPQIATTLSPRSFAS
jgi:hypothetical protein